MAKVVNKRIKTNKGTTVSVRCQWVSQQGRRRELCNATTNGGGYKKGEIVSNRTKGNIRGVSGGRRRRR